MRSKQQPSVTGEMIRAARALIRMSRQDLAHAAGIGAEAVRRVEEARGLVRTGGDTVARIVGALAELGVSLRYDGVCSELVATAAARAPGLPFEGPGDADVHRLVYVSEVGVLPDALDGALVRIRQAAKPRNHRLGVTGALWARNGCFLQALEGPRSSLQALYGLIALDAAHRRPRLLDHGPVAHRLFPEWLLCGRDPPRGLIGVPQVSLDIEAGPALALLCSLVAGART